MYQKNTESKHKPDSAQEEIIQSYFLENPPKFILALASPGTGKTTTIARLIEQLELRNKLKTMNILVLTFTKKTRGDLIDKLKNSKISEQRSDEIKIRVKNFHSFAFSMIFWRRIIEDDQLKEIVSKIISEQVDIQENRKKFIKEDALYLISDMLKRGLDKQQWQTEVEILKQKKRKGVAETVLKYIEVLQQHFNLLKEISYDYSLIKATQMIKQGRRCQKINLDALDLLIIDEFQDSNPAQLRMIDAILERSKRNISLLMVGDFDQNIYTWRGSNMSNIIEFIDRHPPDIRYLKNSYRLSQPIRDLSQGLITSVPSYNTLRQKYYHEYQLQALNLRQNDPQVIQFQSQVTEVRFVIDKIYEHIANGVQFGDITVLLRGLKNTSFVKRLKYQLTRRVKLGQQEIPYDVQVHRDVLRSRTAKYMLALFGYFLKRQLRKPVQKYIKVILKPIASIGDRDQVKKRMLLQHQIDSRHFKYDKKPNNQAKRLQTWEKFFIDFQTIEKIINNAKSQGEESTIGDVCWQIYTVLKDSLWKSKQLDLKEDKIKEFIELVVDLSIDTLPQDRVKEPVFCVMKRLLREDYGPEDEDERISKQQRRQLRKKPKINRVQIQTIHSAKGLEFRVVFLCSLNFSYMPDYDRNRVFFFKNDAQRKKEQERLKNSRIESENEELRLVYTAITRSSEYVYITSSQEDIKCPFQFNNYYQGPSEHPQFTFLMRSSNNAHKILLDPKLDGPSDRYYKQCLFQQQKKIERKSRGRADKPHYCSKNFTFQEFKYPEQRLYSQYKIIQKNLGWEPQINKLYNFWRSY